MVVRKNRKSNRLRIAVYNISNGGKERLNYIKNVIKEIGPDICGILEAVGWQNDEKRFVNFAKNLGYKIFNIATANSKYNIAVFSKLPLEVNGIKEGIRHVILEAALKSGPFK